MKKNIGFTLTEIILALSVIFILSISVIFTYNIVQEKHNINKALNWILMIKNNMKTLSVIDNTSEGSIAMFKESKNIPPEMKKNGEFIKES